MAMLLWNSLEDGGQQAVQFVISVISAPQPLSNPLERCRSFLNDLVHRATCRVVGANVHVGNVHRQQRYRPRESQNWRLQHGRSGCRCHQRRAREYSGRWQSGSRAEDESMTANGASRVTVSICCVTYNHEKFIA
jgi:hypothetical protein